MKLIKKKKKKIDLIVHTYLSTSEKIGNKSIKEIVDKVSNLFTRLHVLVVGPGLSRDESMINTAKELIFKAREQNMSIVVDADGLYLVQQYPETIHQLRKITLPPLLRAFGQLQKLQV